MILDIDQLARGVTARLQVRSVQVRSATFPQGGGLAAEIDSVLKMATEPLSMGEIMQSIRADATPSRVSSHLSKLSTRPGYVVSKRHTGIRWVKTYQWVQGNGS